MSRILLVEDNLADVVLLRVALAARGVRDLAVAEDPAVAANYLCQVASGFVPRPQVVLLDLRLPGESGHGVLARIRADKQLRDLRVIVYSISAYDQDIRRSIDLGAEHVVKSDGIDGMEKFATQVSGLLKPAPGPEVRIRDDRENRQFEVRVYCWVGTQDDRYLVANFFPYGIDKAAALREARLSAHAAADRLHIPWVQDAADALGG